MIIGTIKKLQMCQRTQMLSTAISPLKFLDRITDGQTRAINIVHSKLTFSVWYVHIPGISKTKKKNYILITHNLMLPKLILTLFRMVIK